MGPRTIQLTPSILDADFTRLGEAVQAVERAGVDWLHLDVMDGHFVPNLSIGVPVVASLARRTDALLDTHLMITDPAKYAPAFAEAGAGLITFHIEVAPQPQALIAQLRELGVKVGVSLNPGTPAEALWPVLPDVDLVLVMTVWPGFGGQSLITDCLTKVSEIATRLRPDQYLQVDGGVNASTIADLVRAGADTLVAGSAIFKHADPAAAVESLRQVALAAATPPTTG